MDAPWRTSRQALFQYLDRIVAFNWREAMACHEPSHTRFALSHRTRVYSWISLCKTMIEAYVS